MVAMSVESEVSFDSDDLLERITDITVASKSPNDSILAKCSKDIIMNGRPFLLTYAEEQ
jgi:hypothetical protein